MLQLEGNIFKLKIKMFYRQGGKRIYSEVTSCTFLFVGVETACYREQLTQIIMYHLTHMLKTIYQERYLLLMINAMCYMVQAHVVRWVENRTSESHVCNFFRCVWGTGSSFLNRCTLERWIACRLADGNYG